MMMAVEPRGSWQGLLPTRFGARADAIVPFPGGVEIRCEVGHFAEEETAMHERALTLAENTPFTETSPDFAGRWVNQMASFMDLDVSGNNVTGTYNSASSGREGGKSIEGELKGYVAGDRISFLVLWPGGSMT